MSEVISQVGNKYLFAEESAYGTTPSPFTALDLGHIQTISLDEDEQTVPINSMNSGHTSIDFEDGVYNLSGSITTFCTQASLPVILKALMGSYSADTPGAGEYTIASSAITSADLSYSMKFNSQTGKIMLMNGIHITGGDVTIDKEGMVEVTLNFQAQVLTPDTESLTPSTNTGDVFMGLDATVTYNGNTTILDTFNINVDWNVDPADGRGIEAEHANGRRVIKRVVRHNLSLSGSFESNMDANIDSGYADDRSNVPIVLTLSRGSNNAHVFTIAAARTNTRSRELSNDASTKKLSCDFLGLDMGVVGDMYESS